MGYDLALLNARKCGAYQAISDMMRGEIRKLNAALSEDDKWMAEWHMRNLCSLADQLDEAEEKFKKEVDTTAA